MNNQPTNCEHRELSTLKQRVNELEIQLAAKENEINQLKQKLKDFTKQVQNEENLHSMIFNNVSDLIFMIRIEPEEIFQCVMVNPSYLSITGFNKEQLVGKTVEEVFSQTDCIKIKQKYREAVQSGITIRYEESFDLPSGHKFFETTLIPIWDQQGVCSHLLGTSYEITERNLL